MWQAGEAAVGYGHVIFRAELSWLRHLISSPGASNQTLFAALSISQCLYSTPRTSLAVMGRPLEMPNSPRDPADASPSSSSTEEDDDQGWVEELEGTSDEGEWEDPSGGLLSQVFAAAEAGDAEELAGLLQGLEVSLVDTRVSAAACRCRHLLRASVAATADEFLSYPLASTHPAGRRQRHGNPSGGPVRPRRVRAAAATARGAGRRGRRRRRAAPARCSRRRLP